MDRELRMLCKNEQLWIEACRARGLDDNVRRHTDAKYHYFRQIDQDYVLSTTQRLFAALWATTGYAVDVKEAIEAIRMGADVGQDIRGELHSFLPLQAVTKSYDKEAADLFQIIMDLLPLTPDVGGDTLPPQRLLTTWMMDMYEHSVAESIGMGENIGMFQKLLSTGANANVTKFIYGRHTSFLELLIEGTEMEAVEALINFGVNVTVYAALSAIEFTLENESLGSESLDMLNLLYQTDAHRVAVRTAIDQNAHRVQYQLLNLLKLQRIREADQRATDYKAIVDEIDTWLKDIQADEQEFEKKDYTSSVAVAASEIKGSLNHVKTRPSKYKTLIDGIHNSFGEEVRDMSEVGNMMRLRL